jgi:hypothetical protein
MTKFHPSRRAVGAVLLALTGVLTAGASMAFADSIEQMSEKYYHYHSKENCQSEGGAFSESSSGTKCVYAQKGITIECAKSGTCKRTDAKKDSKTEAKNEAKNEAKTETIQQMSEKYYHYNSKDNCLKQGGTFAADSAGGSTCVYAKTGVTVACSKSAQCTSKKN